MEGYLKITELIGKWVSSNVDEKLWRRMASLCHTELNHCIYNLYNPMCPLDNASARIQIMAWWWTGSQISLESEMRSILPYMQSSTLLSGILSTLIEAMAWCRQVPSHYRNQNDVLPIRLSGMYFSGFKSMWKHFLPRKMHLKMSLRNGSPQRVKWNTFLPKI